MVGARRALKGFMLSNGPLRLCASRTCRRILFAGNLGKCGYTLHFQVRTHVHVVRLFLKSRTASRKPVFGSSTANPSARASLLSNAPGQVLVIAIYPNGVSEITRAFPRNREGSRRPGLACTK